MKKVFALGVIFLFIGVAVTPSINFTVVKASNDNDLVEVTTQACGIGGFGNTTVKLTRERYQNLEQYLVEFRARLNQTTTREEAVPIFKEAVVELDKYGLLPKGMSVEQFQRLLLGLYQNNKLLKYFEKQSNTSEIPLLQGVNKLCLIYGVAYSYTIFQGPISCMICNGLDILLSILDYIYNKFNIGFNIAIPVVLLIFMNAYKTILLSQLLRNLPYIGATIYYGAVESAPMEPNLYHPAGGSIWTNGLYGKKQWNGPFYGRLSSSKLMVLWTYFYPGVNGFTGLRLYLNSSIVYFGSALSAKVGSSLL